MDTLSFADRVVVVTGAGRGIGRAHALLLAARGAGVVVADFGASVDGSGVDGDDPAADVVAQIRAAGGRAVSCRADVASESGAATMVNAAIGEFGRLDAVINNAGIVRTGRFDEIPVEEYERHLDVHFFGSLFLCRAAWPHLIASGTGRVVNTISAAMLGNPLMTHYGSSKGAVFGLTRNLAIVHPSCQVTGEVFNAAGGAVSRMAVVTTRGIHDTALTVETVAARFDDVMALTPEARPEGVPVPQPHTA
ncbi:SDR family NAD(P)-dependent oxidoreductase [Streptomyces sp. MCAF7]